MSTSYRFLTTWRVPGEADEVAAILGDASALPRWWPSVYLDVRELTPPSPDGRGRVVELLTKGWLPYTLRWTLTVTEPVTTRGFALTAAGDFVGTGQWSFAQDGPEVVVSYDWRISVGKPLLRRLSWLLRPAFSANHRWAMARGEESLKLELRRRRQRQPAEGIPDPPRPRFARHRRL